MPATRKSFSRAHQTTKTRPTGLPLSSFTSKSDPTAAHKARHALKKDKAGGGGRKQHGGAKEKDRELMEALNRGGDVGYKGREMFLAGLTKAAPEAKDADASASGTSAGGGTMNEARRQRIGAGAGTDELVSSLGGMKAK